MARNRIQEGPGPSQRQLRVGELVRRSLSEVLARGEAGDPELDRLSVTVSEVRVSPDLKIATAYVLPLGGKGGAEAVRLLADNKGELRRLAARRMSLKFAPDLRFRVDDLFDRMDETSKLFAQERVRRDVGR